MSTRAPVVFRSRRFVKKAGSKIFEPSCAVNVAALPVQDFMPANGEPFEFAAGVALPAIGSSATVVSFTVPRGRNGYIRRIGNIFVGGGFVDFSGAIIWQIFLDLTKNAVAPGFNNIVASLGAVSAPSQIDGIRVKENALVALVVTNVSVVVSGQVIGGRFGGAFHPIPQEPPNIAF